MKRFINSNRVRLLFALALVAVLVVSIFGLFQPQRVSGPFGASGDNVYQGSSFSTNRVPYVDSNGELSGLAAGSAGQVLTSNATATPYWSTPGAGAGDMTKAVYDPTSSGTVNSALVSTNATYAATAGSAGSATVSTNATNVVAGGSVVTGNVTDSALTATRVPFATTDGLLTDSSALTFTSGNGTLGATYFVGDGSALTGITAGAAGGTFYVLATSDATAAQKAIANVILNGTADQTAINTALSTHTLVSIIGSNINITGSINLVDSCILDGGNVVATISSNGTSAIYGHNLGVWAPTIGSIVVKNFFINGNYGTGNIGIDLDGVNFSTFQNFRFVGCVGGDLVETANSVNPTAYNTFRDFTGYNELKFVTMSGYSGTKPVTDNSYYDFTWWGAYGQASAVGIDFIKNADNNLFYNARLNMSTSGQTAVIYNSDSAGAERNVYEDVFYNGFIQQETAGTHSIVANYCTPGRPSFITMLISGGSETLPELSATSCIEFKNTVWGSVGNVQSLDAWGYIRQGEIKTITGTLVAGNTNAWSIQLANRATNNCILLDMEVGIELAGGSANSTMAIGVADNTTTQVDDIFNAIPLNSAYNLYSTYNATDRGATGLTKPKYWNATGTQSCITGRILVANAASLTGTYTIRFMGR